MRGKRGPSPIRRAFTRNLISFVLVPVLVVFLICFTLLYRNFHNRAINNILSVHESLDSIIEDEVAETSMLLASLVYADNSSIIDYINACDTVDVTARYNAQQRLHAMLDYALQSDSSILSMIFRFRSGVNVFYGGELNFNANARIRHRFDSTDEDIVYVNAFRSGSYERLYTGLGDNQLVYSALIYPSWMLDRQDNIVSIELVRLSDLGQEIAKYDTAYALGNNSIGYSCLIDNTTGSILAGNRIDRSLVLDWQSGIEHFGYTYITSPVTANEIDASILTIVRSSDITGSYLIPLVATASLVIVVMLFLWTFSHLLMKNIIDPVAKVSGGLRKVEEGDLDMVLEEEGYEEVARTIGSFNGMVRHQRALIEDYKSRLKSQERRPDRLFSAYVAGTLKSADEHSADEQLLSQSHILMALYAGNMVSFDEARMYKYLDTDLRFASQCYMAKSGLHALYFIYYRDGRSSGYSEKELISGMMDILNVHFECAPVIVTSRLITRADSAHRAFQQMQGLYPALPLFPDASTLQLESLDEEMSDIVQMAPSFRRYASALCIADEAAVESLRSGLSDSMLLMDSSQARKTVLAVITAFAQRLADSSQSLCSFFGHNPAFTGQLAQMEDVSSIVVYFNNLTSRIMEKTLSQLSQDGADAISRARRYIYDNYQYSDLTLEKVASHVGLNARYLSTRFTKEVGQNFQSYLSELRTGKARQLLRTTGLKVYEVADLCGYASAENFNKAFRKETGMGPLQYRKAGKTE